MSGGEGSIAGSVMGALLLTIISNGLTINGVNSFWQMIISALILIATIIARRKKGLIYRTKTEKKGRYLL